MSRVLHVFQHTFPPPAGDDAAGVGSVLAALAPRTPPMPHAAVRAVLMSSTDVRFTAMADALVIPALQACDACDGGVTGDGQGVRTGRVGYGWVLVGLLTLHLVIPAKPVDPARKPLLKRALVLADLQRTTADLCVREFEERLRSGEARRAATMAPLDTASHAMKERISELSGRATERPTRAQLAAATNAVVRSLESKLVGGEGDEEREEGDAMVVEASGGGGEADGDGDGEPEGGSDAADFLSLHSELWRFCNGVASVERVLDLAQALNVIMTSHSADASSDAGVCLRREGGWQTSADSFLSRLTSDFAGYRDVTEPTAAAVHQVKAGLRMMVSDGGGGGRGGGGGVSWLSHNLSD